MHSYQIWTFYIFPFSIYYSSKLTNFLLLQCSHFVSIVTKDNLEKTFTSFTFTWKEANFQFLPSLCFDNYSAAKRLLRIGTCINFLKFLFLVRNLGKFSKEKKLFLGKIYAGISRKRKVVEFDEVSLQDLSRFFERKPSKEISDLNALSRHNYILPWWNAVQIVRTKLVFLRMFFNTQV